MAGRCGKIIKHAPPKIISKCTKMIQQRTVRCGIIIIIEVVSRVDTLRVRFRSTQVT